MRPLPSDNEQGFTLIEAMVALVILGIASVGLVRAAEAHVDTIQGLERRAAAQWVAENALAEATLASSGANPAANPGGSIGGEVAMLDWRWSVRTTIETTDDPDLRQAIVQVRPAGSSAAMVTLRGFVDAGTTTP